MAQHHTYSEAVRAEWVAWYEGEQGRTAQATAEHFGVPVSHVRRELSRTKPDRDAARQLARETQGPVIVWGKDSHTDPYPAVLDALGQAFAFAELAGAIGTDEYRMVLDMARAVQRVVAEQDPASLPLVTVGSP